MRAHQWYFRDMHGCTLESGGSNSTSGLNVSLAIGSSESASIDAE